MKYKKAYLNLSDGIGQEFQVEVKEELHGEVHAVFIDAFSNKNIDAEFGAAIELELAEIKNWMADYRHSEYWCRPAFGTGLTSVPEETQGLIYQKEDGRILRCDRTAVPTIDCLTIDPTKSGHIFKLQNQCNDSGVIAVFNLNENGP